MTHLRPRIGSLKRALRRLLVDRAKDLPDFRHRPPAATERDDRSAAVAYLERLDSTGFMSSRDCARLVADYAADKPGWHATLLEESRRLHEVGLPVYETMAGPMAGGFDWRTLPKSRDRLYRLRAHRFGFVPRLALAAASGGEHLTSLLASLENWIVAASGRLAADAYFSNLVVIYRIVAITWSAPFCVDLARTGNTVAAAICLRFYQILAADIQFLAKRIGDSAPNNHLLSDRFAAWFLATCYPDLFNPADGSTIESAWREELCRQFQADGTNFEQSVHYHDLGCEMAALYLLICLRKGQCPDDVILARIARMLGFQAALADERGVSFALGDATDDPLLPLGSASGWGGGTWQRLYAVLFDTAWPVPADDAKGAERGYWLCTALQPGQIRAQGCLASLPSTGQIAFPEGGYVTFKDQANLILFRTGPSPDSPLHAGHAMSDLLSVYWTWRGRPILEPSGTFTYEIDAGGRDGPSAPRSYFRGPKASNGVALGEHDPLGQTTGRFRGRNSDTRVTTRHRLLDPVLAWAEGRLDENGPLNGHVRGVLHLPGLYTLVYDRPPLSPPKGEMSYHWQFSPETTLSMAEMGRIEVQGFGDAGFVSVGGNIKRIEYVQGRRDPPAGWVSRRYGYLQAAPQLIVVPDSARRDLAFLFGIRDEAGDLPSVEIVSAGPDGLIIEIVPAGGRHIVCIGTISDDGSKMPFDIDFKGDALWLDLSGGSCREVRGLGVQRLFSDVLTLEESGASATGQSGAWALLEQHSGADYWSGRWRRNADRGGR